MNRLFARWADRSQQKMTNSSFTRRHTSEGNGHAQLAFMLMIGEPLAFHSTSLAVQRESVLPAMIASYAGQLDPLIAELRSLLR
jgi:hypothetical protein